MEPELAYINKKNLTEKEILEFYINIDYKPNKALIKMGYEISTPYYQLIKCIEILNEGWSPNWENEQELKWFNYFYMKGGFSYWNPVVYGTSTTVPSALCLKSKELAELAFHLFKPLYQEVYL